MTWKLALHQLQHQDCERQDPNLYGWAPPVRFVPPEPRVVDDVLYRVIDVGGVRKCYTRFTGCKGEEAIKLIINHDEVLLKRGGRKQKAIWNEWKVERRWLKDHAIYRSSKNKTEVNQYQAHLNSLAKLRLACISFFDDAFNYFELLLADDLVPSWTKIVQRITTTSHGNDKSHRVWGRTWSSLKACKRLFLLKYLDVDAVEKQRYYMMYIVRMPQEMPVRQFILRMMEMNSYLQYLPCLREQEEGYNNNNKLVQLKNVQFSNTDIISIVLHAMPMTVSRSYFDAYASETRQYPLSIPILIEDLTRVQAQEVRQETSSHDDHGKPKPALKSKRSLEDGTMTTHSNKRAVAAVIPREEPQDVANKQRVAHIHLQPLSSSARSRRKRKLCRRCAKWKPSVKTTHHTSQCTRWKYNGNPKMKENRESRQDINRSKEVEQFLGSLKEVMNSAFDRIEKNLE